MVTPEVIPLIALLFFVDSTHIPKQKKDTEQSVRED